MKKRVYGILGISSIMANWNADFTGYPKMTSDGTIFGSDKALKYPMKKMWENEGKKVLYIKSLKLEKDDKKGEIQLNPRTLKERYEYIFEPDKVGKNTGEVLKNLFNAVDVKNFGATFAETGNNISITGAVQIGQGFNKYEDSTSQEQQILSPFRDGTKDSDEKGAAKNSSLGTKIVSNEAHYFYPFAINPMAYKEYVELGVTQGYTQEDYNNFKRTSMAAVTSFATNAKIGCENELAVYIETLEDTYLPNLSEYVVFKKGAGENGKNVIELNFAEIVNENMDKIISIEIYYNPYTTQLIHEIKNIKTYHIFTQKEV